MAPREFELSHCATAAMARSQVVFSRKRARLLVCPFAYCAPCKVPRCVTASALSDPVGTIRVNLAANHGAARSGGGPWKSTFILVSHTRLGASRDWTTHRPR